MASFVRRHWVGISAMTILIVVALIVSATGAHAQTVDLRSPAFEVVTWVAGLLATALTAVATVVIRLVLVKIGMENSKLEQNLNDRLNDIIFKGMDFALATAENEMKKKGSGLEAVKFDNIFISYAASYIAERAPEILRKFTVTQEKLEEMIWARVPAYMQTVPITGGAKTPETVKQVERVTGGATSTPVIVEPVRETPLPADRGTGIFKTGEAPNTGA